ncbi:MAG: flagellar motor protein MotB [Lachnospiraceae bacterium]|nr:flagellar motor protein MotB [Lachnospiraceae bacterium]
MAKKKKQEAPAPGSPAWMATFSDLMNLLLTFFILLFSMSSVDVSKFEEIAASLNASFSIFDSGSPAITEGGLISSGVSQLNQLDNYYTSMGTNQDENSDEDISEEELKDKYDEMQSDATEELGGKVEEDLEGEGLLSGEYEGFIDMEITSQYVTLTLNGSVLFNSGRAEIKKDAAVFVDKLGDVLKRYNDNLIEIRGYTDSVPVSAGNKYDDNMELSQARAYSVYKFLVNSKNMSEESLECSGRGEQEPIASNDTAEGRALNRRVEIRIYSILTNE